MKKIIFFSLILTVIFAAGCKKSTKDKLLGVWKLTSVEGQKLTAEDLKTTMTFTDSTFNMKISGNEDKNGHWSLSSDEKTITAKNSAGDKEIWKISKLDEKEFTFSVNDDKEKITLTK